MVPPASSTSATGIGVVVIGRNEGERLRRCLRSLGDRVQQTVYVDSGSSDGSVEFAQGLGARVIALDTSIPFTAARARNEGWRALTTGDGAALEFVQFVDGDCEIEVGWIDRAAEQLVQRADVAVVFGRRREREREASPYNRLCDLEWDVPAGEVLSCGGDAMMRIAALRAVGGFDARLIAGEEPDLCLRLREGGWRIVAIAAPMTVHDAAMHRFGQWWRRALRAGYVEAEGVADRGARYPRRRAVVSNLFWVVGVPVATLACGGWCAWHGRWLALTAVVGAAVALHGLSWWRIRASVTRRWPVRDASLYATFCVLARWPAVHGMAVYCWRRLRRGDRRLIEYKGATSR
jgi:GT2 family glycosyltransferase